MTKWHFVFLLIFLPAMAWSQNNFRMNGSYYVRSTPNFGSNSRNIVGVLSKGSTFKIINQRNLSNGAVIAEIHVTRLSSTSHLNPANQYWIYMGNKDHFIALNQKNDGTQAGTQEENCANCSPVTPTKKNTDALANVSNAISVQNNMPAESSANTEAQTSYSGPLDSLIKKYSESPEVERVINFAIKNKTRHSRGQCYRSVKEALACAKRGKKPQETCLTPSWYSGKSALSAKNQLKNYGFINLLDDANYKAQLTSTRNAPKGAVLVYSSGIPCQQTETEVANSTPVVADCGHIEIKTNDPGKPGYVSDYYDNDPIGETPGARRYTSRYKLVGVMIKQQ